MTDVSHLTSEKDARNALAEYFTALERHLSDRRLAVRNAVRSGVYEHLADAIKAAGRSDLQTVSDAIEALGKPDSFAGAWADAIERARPLTGFSAIGLHLRSHALSLSKLVLAGVSFAVGLIFALAFLGRVVSPDTVGIFVLSDGSWLLGTWTDGASTIARDVLGQATAPVAVALAATFFALAWRMRSVRRTQ